MYYGLCVRALSLTVACYCALTKFPDACVPNSNERMEKLKQQRWQRGGPLSEEALEPLSTSERRFIRDYNDNLQDYTRKMGRLMDVNKDLVPPKESYVEVPPSSF